MADWKKKVIFFDSIYEGILEVEHPRVMILKSETSYYKLVVPESLSTFIVRRDDSFGHQDVKGFVDYDEMMRSLVGKHIKVWISFHTFWSGIFNIRDDDITYDSDKPSKVDAFELSEGTLGG